jgi:CRP-like cAMP-binding protein
MTASDAAQALRAIPFLRDVDDDSLRLAAESLVREERARGAELTRQGSPAAAIYIVAQGEIELLGTDREGKPRRTGVLRRSSRRA